MVFLVVVVVLARRVHLRSTQIAGWAVLDYMDLVVAVVVLLLQLMQKLQALLVVALQVQVGQGLREFQTLVAVVLVVTIFMLVLAVQVMQELLTGHKEINNGTFNRV
jgi:hypothetical protein